MTSQRWMLTVWLSLASVLGRGESVTTTETQKYTCKTFGSGVVQPFNGSSFYVRSNCPFTFTRFTHNRVECDITTRRGDSGLLVQVEIIINKIKTVLQNGSILVEKKSVSLPYDHTYQHIFHYGIYMKLRSSLLPLSVTWHNVPGGIDTLWVELEQELSTEMTGLCGKNSITGNKQQLIKESVLADDTCQIRDAVSVVNQDCRMFFSYTLDCWMPHYMQLCDENIYSYEKSKSISCAFFKEVALKCGRSSSVWNLWRSVTGCAKHSCPGDLIYVEEGPAFVPSCSNPNPRSSNQDLISSCVCPASKVLNDHADGFHCVSVSSCPCVFAGKSYSSGDIRSTKCQSCVCDSGKWQCSENLCPPRCLIEGQFVTTVDGKQYVLPGKCTYVALQGLNWTITIEFSEKAPSLKTVILQLFQETYTFSANTVKFREEEITELHESDHALVFWKSSMYVQVHTFFGMNMQVQMSPEIQLYITPPANHTGMISGLCGNSNNDTTDDFTTSSGIVENSAQPFAQSWSVGACLPNIPNNCINRDNEIFADEKCSMLNDPAGIFAKCQSHIPTDHYHTACVQRTCNCGGSLQQCLCVALSSYAQACASMGVIVGDWRKATNCTVKCPKNQEFSYNTQACNHTCRSLSGPDPCCEVDDATVEGCGCPEGTHLNQDQVCTPKSECKCHYYGGTTPPGPAVLDGRQCLCENGELQCSKDCGCTNGKVCVHCAEHQVNTAQKTCDSLSKPKGTNTTCDSGCYCPYDQYEDHLGNCVSLDNCTCVYSGKVFSAGQSVKTSCKTCVCGQGQWHCRDVPCPGKCQVYGNGHYQTFDSKWYRFDGHCQYTLVEDGCGNSNGTFSVRVESVPCCDEALTCSRSIILDLQDTVTLTLSDMKVTRRHDGWTLMDDSLYSTHTVGLYIIISVPGKGLTLIWDKHTRVTIVLHAGWRNKVCGLCGNFDSNEMNDLQTSGSGVVSSPMVFGNSWKAATPPCSDVTTEIFPCERNSYCSAWAQRRCMIITGDTFKECHFKVDPEPYYHACVQESCSCEFEGKFLGFCTAVAAYAEACSDQDVCVNWRTPDLCPVYCDYYNEQGQCSWHYEACGNVLTCGKGNNFTHKLEGCYPRCSKETPYYDENTGACTKLRNCTCYFNDTVIQPGALVPVQSIMCHCQNGTVTCPSPPTTTPATAPTTIPTTTASTTSETTVLYTTSTPTTATASTETQSTTPQITSTPTSQTPSIIAETTMLSTTSTPATTTVLTTAESWSTAPPIISTPTIATTSTTTSSTTMFSTPTTPTTETTLTKTETWSTAHPIISTPTTTTTSTTTSTTMFSTPTTPTTETTSTKTETWSTANPTTSTQTTPTTPAITETSVLSTNFTPTTTISSTTTETTVISTTAEPITTTSSTTTETTVISTAAEPTTTTSSTTTETTVISTTAEPTATTSSPTTETTVISTTAEPTTTTSSTTTETTVISTTAEPTATTSSTTTETTLISTTAEPTATTSSTTTETTVISTTAEPTATTASTVAETWSTASPTTSIETTPTTPPITGTTVLSTNSTPTDSTASTVAETTAISNTAEPTGTTLTVAETWSTASPTTSIETTPTTPPITGTTLLSTTSTPTTTTSSTTAETWSTTPSTNSTLMTNATSGLTSTENWSTELSTTSTPHQTTTVTSETTEEVTNTSAVTTSTPTTSSTTLSSNPSLTTAFSTQRTIITNSTESTTEQTSTTELPTPESSSSVHTTLHTTPTTSSTKASTTWTTESKPTETTVSTETFTTQLTTEQTEPTASTLQSTTTFATNATTVTTTEEETFMSSAHSTTQPTTTSSEATTSYGVITGSVTPPATQSAGVSNNVSFTTTEVTTPEEPGMSTEQTYPPSVASTTIKTTFRPTESTTVTDTPTTYICECKDLKRKKRWSCGETWTEDCFSKTCTNGKIELTPVVCPETTIPICPRKQVTKVSDGCCETWKCDCRCDLFGDPHYISFQGVTFDFLKECTYVLVEERSPRHHLTIAVDNFFCVPGLQGSCAKGIIVKYQNNTATLDINTNSFMVQATLNNMTIDPPYEEQGFRFETTGYKVFIYLPEVRSYVSLSPSWTLVVNLAMEHFVNNTQGQCGVCGVGSCVRKGGQIEDDSCCDKTAHDWMYDDPLRPACVSGPRDVPCKPGTTQAPTITPTVTTSCPASQLCELLRHSVFSNCSRYVDLILKKRNCEFDACRNGACSSLEHAAEECKKAGFCIDWRRLTNGSCDVMCPEGLVFQECRTKLDDYCDKGTRHAGVSLEDNSTGCFCPSGKLRAQNHSNICVSDCLYCKGPLGEPKLPGDVWQSNCHLCTCNNQTRLEQCFPKPLSTPICSRSAVLVNTSCCGDQICVDKTCSYHGKTYKVGDSWQNENLPCMSFKCSTEGIQTEMRVCPTENCQEEDRIWDDQHCCFTCKQICAPKVTSINITIDNCTAVMQMPVCQGQCASEPRIVLRGVLQVEQEYQSCQVRSAEKRSVTLQCFDFTTRQYAYKHITGCECRACGALHQ